MQFQLWQALWKATFHMNGKDYSFDQHGDLNSGYDIILWRQIQDFLDVRDIVAHYSIEQESLSFTSQETRHALSSQIVSISLHWQVIWFFQYSFMVIIFRLSIVHVSRIRHQYWTDLGKKRGLNFTNSGDLLHATLLFCWDCNMPSLVKSLDSCSDHPHNIWLDSHDCIVFRNSWW